jgi:hypothetical protein
VVTVGYLQQADHLRLEDVPRCGLGLQRKAVHLVMLVDLLKARSLPLRAFVISGVQHLLDCRLWQDHGHTHTLKIRLPMCSMPDLHLIQAIIYLRKRKDEAPETHVDSPFETNSPKENVDFTQLTAIHFPMHLHWICYTP